MGITMPFVCEERIVEWELQAYPNELSEDMAAELEDQQYHVILCITVRKLKSKRKTTGGFRVIAEPA